MRWTVPLLSVLLAGCGTAAREPAQPLTPPEPAEPRLVELNWRESYGEGERRLRFEVTSPEVRRDGWSARIALGTAPAPRSSSGAGRSRSRSG